MHELTSFVAKYLILVSTLIFAAYWVKQKQRQRKEILALAIIGGVVTILLAELGSHLFYNPRPFVVGHFSPYFSATNDNGFPSDHTLLAALLAFLIWRYDKKIAQLLLLVAILLGLSRMIAGVHHLIDIAGAILIAGTGVYLASLVVQNSSAKKPAKQTS